MKQYLDILQEIMDKGVDRPDRTGVGTRSVFGRPMRYRMSDGFPAMTTKRLAFRLVLSELLWMLSGDSDVRNLHLLNNHIWDGNAFADYWLPKAKFVGDAGRNYSKQWREWRGPEGQVIDQIRDVIERIKKVPYDRRLIVTAWNPAEVGETCLPACHAFFQFYVAEGRLTIGMYQRSCDMFLGVPFNIAQYALILHLFARFTGLEPDELFHVLADAHVYFTHFDAVKEQLERTPRPLPSLWLTPEIKSFDDVATLYQQALELARSGGKSGPFLDGIARLENYDPHGPIKAPMAV